MNDLRRRLLFLLGALIVFRVGAHIPVPGVNAAALANSFKEGNAGILGMLNLFSGGSLERFSIFAIGIMPYISASIIIQLVAEVLPSLKALKKEGEAGRRTLTKYTRWGTLLVAVVQASTAAAFVYQQPDLVVIGRTEFYISTITCLVTGTMFLMWLGEQMTERGIGNGVSLLITAGIVAALPSAISNLLNLAITGDSRRYGAILFVLFGGLCLIYIVVYIESAQRKIPIHYARRQIGNRIVQGQKTHLPFKMNMAGVIPPIFASSVILFPSQIIGWLDKRVDGNVVVDFISANLSPGKSLYLVVFAAAIIFFCYFYTALVFSPREMAENLKKSGAFVPGIRPGEQTSNYLEKVVMRLTFFGALYITIICLIPEFVTGVLGIPFHLGGTSLLILVVVTMDFGTQVASYRMNQQYEHLMRKSSAKK
ncbi:preprotein translocase subunit SecY [Eikenella corrodens]|uniref:Protein translocase subunit SecY n=1 Tax=Eikenella corrodens TaxID=539 RepID=A0A1A9RIB0_EIKCO|nr:preprotein translocase subunit SecY [Eikenella corrodens]OAM18437.1 preprotein translocase subunit SecY [Eikenella corrodens]OAM25246.1 preprotein translocase subunit SecY [Eikenella corrodens]